MGTKQKVSPNGTYVFDPEEIEQLDELSLTSVLSAVVDGSPEEAPETESHNTESPNIAPPAGDTTINELLSGQLEPDGPLPAQTELGEDPGDLIDPELLFPNLPKSKGGKGR